MNKRQLDIANLLLNGGKYGGLATLIRQSVHESPDELAEVAAAMALASADDEALLKKRLTALKVTLLRVCDDLGIARLTVSRASGQWRITRSKPRSRIDTKIETLLRDAKEIAANLDLRARQTLVARLTSALLKDNT